MLLGLGRGRFCRPWLPASRRRREQASKHKEREIKDGEDSLCLRRFLVYWMSECFPTRVPRTYVPVTDTNHLGPQDSNRKWMQYAISLKKRPASSVDGFTPLCHMLQVLFSFGNTSDIGTWSCLPWILLLFLSFLWRSFSMYFLMNLFVLYSNGWLLVYVFHF